MKFFISILILIFFTNCGDTSREEAQEKKGQMAFPVEIGRVVYRDIVDEVRAVGNIQAKQRVVITSEVAGKVFDIAAEEGQRVNFGQVLATIDSRDYKLEVQRLSADKRAAEQEHEKALIGLRPEEQDKLRAQARAERSALDLAMKEQARTQKLVDEKVLSPAELDISIDKVRRAKEMFLASQATLSAALQSREEDIVQKNSDLEAVKHRLEQARLALTKTRIVAPFDGVVLSKRIEQGAFASMGSPVLEMIGSSRLKAVMELPQKNSHKLKNLREIEFWIRDLDLRFKSVKDLSSSVRFIPNANIYSGNITVQIELNDPDPNLFPGLTLEGNFKFDTRTNVAHVPSVALVITKRGTVVYTVTDGKANLVPVKAFKERDGFIEIVDITNQLGPDIDLILRGSGAVFPGANVFPTNPEPKTRPPFNAADKLDRNSETQKPGAG